jgi:arginine exporter protein ArgO
MLHALWVLAAEKAEPDKTAFFIGGAILASWAVVLSFIGLRNPKLPDNAQQARLIMAISVALVVVAMATAVATD